jgi:hypothetical protein
MQEPLVPIVAPGVHAYAEKTVEAGSDIHFRISGPPGDTFQLSILRPELDLNGTTLAKEVLITPTPFSGTFSSQPVTPGSYVNVDNALPAEQSLSALTLECWVRPSQFFPNASEEEWWGLITQYSRPTACGIGLFLTSLGSVALYLGHGGDFDGKRLFECSQALKSPFEWAHVVGVWDGTQASLYVNAQLQQHWPLTGTIKPGPAPLRLAAYGEDGNTSHILEGDLAMPVIYGRALSALEIQKRYHEDQGLHLPPLDSVLACWPLTEEKGITVADISPAERTGTLINHATWMIGGPSFNAAAVPRFGEYNPTKDPTRGHGLRFASDDLFDAGWSTTATLSLPKDLKPGIYVGRISYESSDSPASYDVTFVVKKAQDAARKRMVVLCATNTWLAYACTPFVSHATGSPPPLWGTNGRYANGANERTEPPPGTLGYNFYCDHQAQQPTYQVGVNLPWPAASPDVRYFGDVDYSHLTRAELFTHYWLEQNGYDYDVITDFDLHRDPAALDGYQVLLIAGHSEYWSHQAYQAVDDFLKGGHDVIVLSGNTMFWRVSFDPDFKVMQCRKALYLPGGRNNANTGETWHSGDNQRGGLMRECGHPAWQVLGMESSGLWNAPVLKDYTCDLPRHELFHTPIPIDLQEGGILAAQAVGHEFDVTLSLPQQSNVGTPEPLDSVPLQPDRDRIQTLGHSRPYWNEKEPQQSYTIWDFRIQNADPTNKKLYDSLRSSEIIYWERSRGGRVFYAGSIAAGRALWGGTPSGSTPWSDNKAWQDLLRNVLAKFGVDPSITTS